MKKKLLYDLTATQTNERIKFDGGSVYASIVFHKAIESGLIDFECVYNSKLYLDNKIKNLCITNNIKLNKANTINDIKVLIEKVGYKKFYSAMPYQYIDFNFEKTLFVFTIHGLRFLEMPYDNTEIYYFPGIFRKILYLLKGFLKSRQRFGEHKKKFDKLLGLGNKKIVVSFRAYQIFAIDIFIRN